MLISYCLTLDLMAWTMLSIHKSVTIELRLRRTMVLGPIIFTNPQIFNVIQIDSLGNHNIC